MIEVNRLRRPAENVAKDSNKGVVKGAGLRVRGRDLFVKKLECRKISRAS